MQINKDIQLAQDGNTWIREKIISDHKPYILNVVSHICRRFVSWSDEEASIGLLAFNRAIDTYQPQKGRKFLSFAYCLMDRDLINYFYSCKKRNDHMVIGQTDEAYSQMPEAEIKKSMQYYQEKTASSHLVEEILELNRELSKFKIFFEDLESHCPKHIDTRIMLYKMALDFIQHEKLLDEMDRKKRFPAAEFIKNTGYSRKTVESYRKYLITLVVISLHPEWTQLNFRIKMSNTN